MKNATLIISVLLLLLSACQKNDMRIVHEGAEDLTDLINMEKHLNLTFASYAVQIPTYLQAVGMQAPVLDDKKAALGRVLFYDKTLSRDGSVSCATCHQQAKAFSDVQPFSRGVNGQFSARNSMPLGNTTNFAAHYRAIGSNNVPNLLWDDHTSKLADVARMALTNPLEMGMTMPEVVNRVQENVYYPHIWKQVFGHTKVYEQDILEAIGAFVGAISNTDSKFDRALIESSGQIGEIVTDTIVANIYYGGSDTTIITIVPLMLFSQSEFRGLGLFVTNCSPCHSPIRPFQEVFVACNGLDMEYTDAGMARVTGNPAHSGVFKSPPLRNIALTAPYMHDGRFKTLQEVVEFYSTGVQEHPNLHPAMRAADGSIHRNFTEQEKLDLVAFLHTLTDLSIQQDARFSDPFK